MYISKIKIGDTTYDIKAVAGGTDTTYQLSVNGTANGDSTNGISLGTIYAPTTAGTSGQILTSTGGIPTWTDAPSSGMDQQDVLMASQIGLIPNDSTKGSANSAIIASLVENGKSLFMDRDEVYYINGDSWEIGYEFSISGKATIVCNGYMFKPVAGGSIIFDGITFKGTDGLPEDALIINTTSIDYQINTISITNCVFDGLDRIVLLTGVDQDYATTPYGIKDFRF